MSGIYPNHTVSAIVGTMGNMQIQTIKLKYDRGKWIPTNVDLCMYTDVANRWRHSFTICVETNWAHQKRHCYVKRI